jgi:hypothetical protein
MVLQCNQPLKATAILHWILTLWTDVIISISYFEVQKFTYAHCLFETSNLRTLLRQFGSESQLGCVSSVEARAKKHHLLPCNLWKEVSRFLIRLSEHTAEAYLITRYTWINLLKQPNKTGTELLKIVFLDWKHIPLNLVHS